jgi:hypothetical protein
MRLWGEMEDIMGGNGNGNLMVMKFISIKLDSSPIFLHSW